MAYNRDKLFANIGKSIARYNELEDQKDELETIMGEHMVLLDDDEEERDFEHNVHITHNRDKSRIDTSRASVVSSLRTYFLNGVAVDLEIVDPDVDKVLDALEDAMYVAGDTVKAQVVPPPDSPLPSKKDVRFYIDNEGVGELDYASFQEQQAHQYPAMKF